MKEEVLPTQYVMILCGHISVQVVTCSNCSKSMIPSAPTVDAASLVTSSAAR